MVTISRMSDPNRPQSELEKIANMPAEFAAGKMAGMRHNTLLNIPDEKRNPVGEFVEENSVKAVVGMNAMLEDGAQNLRRPGVWPKIQGALQLAGGNIIKIVASLIGMTPTLISNGVAMVQDVIGGFGKKQDAGQLASASTEAGAPPAQPLQRKEQQQPNPGNIPNAAPLQERGIGT
jgi:hypothetical protein